MDKETLIGKIINYYFGERENIDELVKVVIEINNLYQRIENNERDRNEWNSYYTK